MKSYLELVNLKTFDERLNYLKVNDNFIGRETFGGHRWLNQRFYLSPEWKKVRDIVILRDMSLDLGVRGYDIFGKILVHHIEPITLEDISNQNFGKLLDTNNLITVSYDTHNLIHFGKNDSALSKYGNERMKGDTALWQEKKKSK